MTPGAAATPRGLDDLTPDQREWAIASERLWQRAHAIAGRFPELDVSDLYHALRCLAMTPSRRLAAGLQRGRFHAHRR